LIDQSVYFVEKRNKPVLLAHLYNHLPMSRAIVFTRTKHGADRVVRHLHTRGIRAEAIHGNKSQNARERALDNFRSCKTPILVATDIASRGIDVDGVSHVVNYDLTHEPETYVHRIGRTARAGASGMAVSFCDHEEKPNLKAIESLIRQRIAVRNDHPEYPAQQPGHASVQNAPSHSAGRRQQHNGPARRRDEDAPQRHHSGNHESGQHHNTTRHEPAPRRDQAARHPQTRHNQPRQEPSRRNQPHHAQPAQATLAGMAGQSSRPAHPLARHPLHGGGSNRKNPVRHPVGRGVKQRAF
jgi:ATP-dependent RNA helicase RhlE